MENVTAEEDNTFLSAALPLPLVDENDEDILREFGLTTADLDSIDNYNEDRDDYYNDPYSEY